jgi:hypothetical protein
MALDPRDLHVDGNAAAGLLASVFRGDVTTVEGVCAGCGATGPVGQLIAYGGVMGAILRCPSCDGAVIRVTQIHGVSWLDLRGARVLRIGAPEA